MERLGPVSVLHVAGDCLDVQEGELDGEAVFTLACAVEVYNVSHTLCSDVFVSTFIYFYSGISTVIRPSLCAQLASW